MTMRSWIAVLAGLLAFPGCAREPAPGVRRVGTEELRGMLASGRPPVLLDVRTPGEWANGHLPGAVHVPDYAVKERLAELEPYRGQPIVVYCQSGVRSARVAGYLAAQGFPEVMDYSEGWGGWRRSAR
jgi:rhodanese-related sulfurtransferase